MRIRLFVVLLLMVSHAGGQSLKKAPKQLILFSIQNAPVYADEFIRLYKKNHLKKEDFTQPRVIEYLDLFVNFKLKVAEAKARGLDTTAIFLKEFKSYKEELKKPYLAEKDDLDRLTKEAYQRMTEEVKVSHILITVKPDALPADTLIAYHKVEEARQKIIGGMDFEKIARDISEDPSAKANGGNLGYFSALQMVYPFEQAAYTLKVGEISQPVRTRLGYHLLKVMDRRPAQGEVEVSHIILRTGSGNDTKPKNKILEIYDQLQGGRNWEELCKEYSDDPATKDSGGKLRPFGVGAMAGVPEFEAMAFSLKEPGEISDPFQSAYGWHIIRLEKKIPIPPYAEVEVALKRKVSHDERVQIADRRRLEEKRKKYGFSGDSEVRTRFMEFADSNLQKGKWKFKGDDSFRTKTLFTLQNQNYSAGEFIKFIEKNQSPSGQLPQARMTLLYDEFLAEKLSEKEDVKLLEGNAELRDVLNEYKEGILFFTIMEKEVWNRAPEDSVGLKQLYEDNKEKYKVGERVRAKVFSTKDKSFFEEIKKKVAAGDSLREADLKKFKSIQPLHNYARGDNKAVDKVSWAIGVYYVDVDETYYLVEIDNLIPPGIKSFEEARASVVTDYQEVLEKKWIAEMKKKNPVKINNKGKKFALNELTKK